MLSISYTQKRARLARFYFREVGDFIDINAISAVIIPKYGHFLGLLWEIFSLDFPE
ncbi:MAG: hypothetical protein NTW32_26895 [Chloroflexi bacterium]|nr:hypothetical protein [Chloroflexota bacterium]